ncbi:MAG: P-II family nitrogen regulator [Gammaproteobacteria bacterium]|nr:P-II family nitrogen regulator [Gammaproteobacteria bacterium]MDH5730491.1 P-II family nitrogen regulator [Gammaproteobacteria bacterium]
MSVKQVVAILQKSRINQVIEALKETGVPGASISSIKGYGEYVNTFSNDGLEDKIKLEVVISEKDVYRVVGIILDHASTGSEGDGIVSVHSVDEVYRVRDKKRITGTAKASENA